MYALLSYYGLSRKPAFTRHSFTQTSFDTTQPLRKEVHTSARARPHLGSLLQQQQEQQQQGTKKTAAPLQHILSFVPTMGWKQNLQPRRCFFDPPREQPANMHFYQ